MLVQRYDPSRPWCRQPCDTDESFEAFQIYLALQPPRHLGQLARRWAVEELERWREDGAWIERAYAFDVDIGDMIHAPIDPTGERDDRHLEVTRDVCALAQVEVRKLLRIAEQRSEPTVEVRELVKLVRDGIELERLVSGASTENVAVAAGAVDLSRLTLEEIETLRALEEKAGAATRE